MIDVEREHPITLAEAAKRLPGRPHVSTVWRWTTSGVGPHRTRLEVFRRGGRRFTTVEALKRFLIAQNPDGDVDGSRPDRDDAIARAEAELDREWA